MDRREFFKTSGALVISFSLPSAEVLAQGAEKPALVPGELDVGFDKVTVLMGDTATSCNQGGASGSTGTSNGARLLRKAAAEARRVLVDRASEKLGAPAAQLRVEDGTVLGPSGKTTYADLVGGRYF